MRELYGYILELIRSGKRGALATIVHQAGSSPRGLGAQM
ncbi:MAG: XdhC family protein, partial [Deltaproteobacteria bacterium]